MENFLRGSKKWGCKAKKVGGVNTQNTPGFGPCPYTIVEYIVIASYVLHKVYKHFRV